MNLTMYLYEMPCYLDEIRNALNYGPLSISEIEYDTEFIYSYLPAVPQFPQFPQVPQFPMIPSFPFPIVPQLPRFPSIDYNYLDLIFVLGLFTSCAFLSFCNKQKKNQVSKIKISNFDKNFDKTKNIEIKDFDKNSDKTKNTEIKDFETKDTGTEIV